MRAARHFPITLAKKSYYVIRDGEPDMRFEGVQIAEVSSQSEGSQRWTVLRLFRTIGGRFIAVEEGHSVMAHEHTKYKADICETSEEVVNALGYGRLAKALYRAADINIAEEIQ